MPFPARFAEVIESEGEEECQKLVKEYYAKNETAKDFPGNTLEEKKRVWSAISERLTKPSITSPELSSLLLGALRILSRDKPVIEKVVEEPVIKTLLKIAGLSTESDSSRSHQETLESLKVTFNLIYQSKQLQIVLINNGLLEGLIHAIQDFTKILPECQYFTLRVFFMITALRPQTARQVRKEMNSVEYIINIMEHFAAAAEPLGDTTVDTINEAMKVLYNIIHDVVPVDMVTIITARPNEDDDEDNEDLSYLLKITQLVRKFLLVSTTDNDRNYELQSHSIDLLSAVTSDCFEELIPEGVESPFQFEDHDMSCIEKMVCFLQHRLDNMENSRSPSNTVSPVLAVMYRMALSNREIRKYLKKRILPPLKRTDLMERPEVGTTLRNKLCALLTSPTGTDLVANLLFVLCKENVNRMIKYTGYGNAAGLLAKKGLMLGGAQNVDDYSDTESDSDTEEYREVRHLINDVEGWLQPERPHPCEGMTDEQKEYEAMKLVRAIDQLQRNNLIQPCTISADGKPIPVEHVLQLQSAIPRAFNNQDSSDSD